MAETGASRSTAGGKISSPPSATAEKEKRRLVNLDITPPLQKTEVSHKIKLHRTELEARQANHIGENAPAVAPVQRNDRNAVPRAGRVAVATVGRQFIERNCTEPLAFDHHPGGFGQLWI